MALTRKHFEFLAAMIADFRHHQDPERLECDLKTFCARYTQALRPGGHPTNNGTFDRAWFDNRVEELAALEDLDFYKYVRD